MRKVMLLDTWEQVELLGHDGRLAILELCVRPKTVTQMAETLRVPRTRLYHHVKRLNEHGLLRVVKTKQVGPVTESHYQTSAHSYRPSKQLIRSLSESAMGSALMTVVLGPARADFVRSLEKGAFSLAETSRKRSVMIQRGLMNLTPNELDQVIKEIEAILGRYDTGPAVERPGTIPVSMVSLIHPRWDRTTQ
jgi:DNA-binding transcriptional ArsR family regulator